ncbi:hypothetical protein DYBT9275_02748 [Dyadobacter sp. CECT 9275]|uniref:Uncharacterized protein n=1 Tax=Dyadobacter helix TaxID=2822344 RepID=A0A916N4Q3_9BACT|nr:hypothetical protein [Dyadobacter sp. CECT 9275]CAG5001822.1 hypothetical protein DYBT9275_02748 [Dyadobacter sp. CECT 9275]
MKTEKQELEIEVKYFETDDERADKRNGLKLRNNSPELINYAVEFSLKMHVDEGIITLERIDNVLITNVAVYVIVFKQ